MTFEVIPASGGSEHSCYVSEYEFHYKSRTKCFHSEEVIRLHITNTGINQYPKFQMGCAEKDAILFLHRSCQNAQPVQKHEEMIRQTQGRSILFIK